MPPFCPILLLCPALLVIIFLSVIFIFNAFQDDSFLLIEVNYSL